MTRDKTMDAVIRELEKRGARVERSDFYPLGARLYSGRTQPFLDFELLNDGDYFEEEWYNPYRREQIIEAGYQF